MPAKIKKEHRSPTLAVLSVVIPAYNSEQWIGPTLQHLAEALSNGYWKSVEVLVIDDGSTDSTAIAAKQAGVDLDVKVINQPNRGRLETRKNGINSASGDYVLMLDSRVYTKPSSFKYLTEQMAKNPQAVVWNGHVEVERSGNPYARFWYAITFMAWRRYLIRPKLMSYGAADFDLYPKGAGCFLAPREYLLKAYAQFSTFYKDSRNANDDTSLIRNIAGMADIYISPGFAFTYNSRSTMRAFTRHTLHRGVVFIDGYGRSGSRYLYPLILYLVAVPISLIVVILMPVLLMLIVPLLTALFITAVIMRVPGKDAAALTYVMPVFAIFYTLGLYKGVILRLR